MQTKKHNTLRLGQKPTLPVHQDSPEPVLPANTIDLDRELTIEEFSAQIKRHVNTIRKWTSRKKNPLRVIRYSRRDVRYTFALFYEFQARCVTKGGAR